jgi:hypothetical protein
MGRFWSWSVSPSTGSHFGGAELRPRINPLEYAYHLSEW